MIKSVCVCVIYISKILISYKLDRWHIIRNFSHETVPFGRKTKKGNKKQYAESHSLPPPQGYKGN